MLKRKASAVVCASAAVLNSSTEPITALRSIQLDFVPSKYPTLSPDFSYALQTALLMSCAPEQFVSFS